MRFETLDKQLLWATLSLWTLRGFAYFIRVSPTVEWAGVEADLAAVRFFFLRQD